MTKREKAQLINKYLETSELAKKYNAKAVILEDGRIEYRMTKRYEMRVTFSKILNLLNGPEMRELNTKLN
jgi:hypothetical protein